MEEDTRISTSTSNAHADADAQPHAHAAASSTTSSSSSSTCSTDTTSCGNASNTGGSSSEESTVGSAIITTSLFSQTNEIQTICQTEHQHDDDDHHHDDDAHADQNQADAHEQDDYHHDTKAKLDYKSSSTTSSSCDDRSVFALPTPRMARRSSRMLKRISSTTSFDMTLLSATIKNRKRKRKEAEDDNTSVQSLNLSKSTSSGERKTKRRSFARVTSLANMLSPASSHINKALERSYSFKAPSSPHLGRKSITPYKKPKPAGKEQMVNRFWFETVQPDIRNSLSDKDCKRQEAIYELVEGESNLVKDLKMVHKLYYNSMKQLNLVTDEELDRIFGMVGQLVPFHEDLLQKLRMLQNGDGVTDDIGRTMLDWLPNLRQYEAYCANLVFAKDLLDYKKTEAKVEDFLNRCQDSPFARGLDLWTFLDLPRSRLVKYPLLLRQIHKYTNDETNEKRDLQEAVHLTEAIINGVDKKMGEAKCRHFIDSLDYLYPSQRSCCIEQSTSVICSGQLINDKGTKLEVFLFDQVLVVTRQVTRHNKLVYQVVKEPIPVSDLEVTDLTEVQGRRGSFKSKVLRHPSTDKFAFRVAFKELQQGHSHVLQARDEHDKLQWMNCIHKVLKPSCGDNVSSINSSEESLSKLSNTSSVSNDQINVLSDSDSPSNNCFTENNQPKQVPIETVV